MSKTIVVMAALGVLLGACSDDAAQKAEDAPVVAKPQRPEPRRAEVPKARMPREFSRRPDAPTAQQAAGAEMVRSAVAAVPSRDVPAVMSIVSCLSRADVGPYDPARRAERIRTVAADVAAHRPVGGRCADAAPGSIRDRLTKAPG